VCVSAASQFPQNGVGDQRLPLATFGVRREDLIVKDVPKDVIAGGCGRYDRRHLVFEEHGKWTPVDYTTDRELAVVGEGRYRRQVALYASAIAEATGQPAAGVLVRV
jgi:hypothetical protein